MLKVIHLSTKNVKCGIATYAHNLISSLDELCHNTHHTVPVEELSQVNIDDYYDNFIQRCADYDAIHIQHEHGIFTHGGGIEDSIERTGKILTRLAKKYTNKKIAITFHTAPEFFTTLRQAIHFKSTPVTINYFLSRMWKNYIVRTFKKYKNLHIIVHSQITKDKLTNTGVPEESISIITHGVMPMQSDKNHEPVDSFADNINLGIFGFIAEYKGHDLAIRAMQYLPERYNLMILGGRHPNNMSDVIEHRLALIEELDLQDRVKVTGYLTEEEFNTYNKDIAIYLAPYTDHDLSASGAITWSLTSGKPVIGTFIPAFNNICKDYECMIRVHHESPRELAWRIVQLIESPKIQRELVSNCRRYSEENSWASTAKKHLGLYTAIN